MPEGTIDGTPYEISIGDRGQTLWETASVAQERDEIWDDLSLGLGETKRETGRGYLFARGWDASVRGAVRLSPFYHNLNNTDLTTGYAYMMEDVETTGSTLQLDAFSTSKGSLTSLASLSWDHTVGTNAERLLIVCISRNIGAPTKGTNWIITYAGLSLGFLNSIGGSAGNNAGIYIYFLLDPPTGTNSIKVINNTATTQSIVTGGASFDGVNADTPFGTNVGAKGTDQTPTATVITASGEQILAVVALEGSATVAAGTNETERWDDAQGSDITGAGYTQAGSDGGVIAPNQTTGVDWVLMAVPIKPSSTTSRSVMHISDETKIGRYTFDPDTGITLSATDTTASAVAGRPAKMNGNWYSPMGSAASAQKLTGVTWADVTGTWKADHLSTFQKGVTPTLARVNSTTQNTVELNADTGDVGDNWTNESEKVGDTSAKITELVEAQGQLYVCKEDNLYAFGTEAESFPVIPFIQRGKIDSDNGKGSFAFGDEIVYMSKGDLWRYRIGRGALPIGLNTIRSWRKIGSIADSSLPKTGRPAYGVHVGEYWYYLQNEGQESHLIQARKRREGDPEGHELIQHSVLSIPLSKGLGVDSRNRLWIKGASLDETQRDIRVIQLAEDGSLDIQNRKGQANEIHSINFDERNPGRPQDQAQLRHFTVELEGDWDSSTPLLVQVWRDDAISPESVPGGTITAAGVTTRNWTVGTNDTAYRFRPQLVVSTTSLYTPKNSDPQVLRVIVGIRFPEIIRIVIPADEGVVEGDTELDVEQNLRRLQNQGIVAFQKPGDITTFNAEVFSVTDTMYATQTGFAHGIQIQARRWITP